MIFGEDCILYIILLTGRPVWGAGSYLMLMRYCAKATLSAFPVIVMVLSRLAGASLSSQFEILIIAPESCLKKVMLTRLCMGMFVGTFIGKQSLL